jgi:hypothetical protein
MTDPTDFTGTTPEGAHLTERELFDKMWQAAWRASQECQARGYSLSDKVTKDSARAAADEVFRQHRPAESTPQPPTLPPLPDPQRERMEREPQV